MLHKIGHYVTNRANFIFNGNNVSLFYMVAVVVLLCINVRNIPLKQFCLPYAIAFLLIFIIIGFIDGMLTLRIPMVYYSVAFGVVLFIALREFLAPSYIIFGGIFLYKVKNILYTGKDVQLWTMYPPWGEWFYYFNLFS